MVIKLLVIVGIAIMSSKRMLREAQGPNIILILADDLGYNHLGVYGQERIKTPHIDKLASEGMRFTRFYAGGSVCGPSRAALMLGLHSGHVPYRDNGDNHLAHVYEPVGKLKTMGELFKEAGYRTGYFGKYGLGGKAGWKNGQKPNDRGFDEFWGLLEHGHGHFHFSSYIWHNRKKVSLNNTVRNSEGRSFGLSSLDIDERREHTDDVFASKAIDFIRKQAKNRKPFFCYLSFSLPHTEMLPNETFAQKYRVQGWEEYDSKDNGYHVPVSTPRANFAGMVSQVDDWTGQVMAVLEETGMADHTIIVFTSDNGGQLRETWGDAPSYFFKANGLLKKGKEWHYEGGIRVPMIVRWPDKIKANTLNNHMGYFPDFMPTFAELIETEKPEKTDGISFVPTLLGKNDRQVQHNYLYWERPQYDRVGMTKKIHPTKLRQAVRFGKWKALREDTKGAIELYDLETDLREHFNLADERPDLVKKAAGLMKMAHFEPMELPMTE